MIDRPPLHEGAAGPRARPGPSPSDPPYRHFPLKRTNRRQFLGECQKAHTVTRLKKCVDRECNGSQRVFVERNTAIWRLFTKTMSNCTYCNIN